MNIKRPLQKIEDVLSSARVYITTDTVSFTIDETCGAFGLSYGDIVHVHACHGYTPQVIRQYMFVGVGLHPSGFEAAMDGSIGEKVAWFIKQGETKIFDNLRFISRKDFESNCKLVAKGKYHGTMEQADVI